MLGGEGTSRIGLGCKDDKATSSEYDVVLSLLLDPILQVRALATCVARHYRGEHQSPLDLIPRPWTLPLEHLTGRTLQCEKQLRILSVRAVMILRAVID